MKIKYSILLIALIGLAGCGGKPDVQYTIERAQYSVQVFDGCQYVVAISSDSLTHKGNCTNIIHKFHDNQ